MNKKELIIKTSEKTGFQQAIIESIFDEIIEIVSDQIAQEKTVSISGLGLFSAKYIPKKTKVHNITKVVLNVEAKLDPRFKFSDTYKKRITAQYENYKKIKKND
ncbi:HU family DNA-binding protein [Metamycoplasma equirhinis]|uniref:HU family DNA-binding protein n=1 Tax=Metamycoplasma equirhinis TaxID=92402 RepID=A0ABZ0PBQ5_9BACT|nr:HU family DNA-binding protein [Metamycoplasma equirhinis]TPD98182.1 HU family DNA-binding protein [Metamycoplasma equirhinis]WPB54226.1 HU family DNA-binding protein [Metamycoplasma equirhinis]BDX52670.1 hypothetical protein JPM7_2770 [Metamycoplasma equirhinis]